MLKLRSRFAGATSTWSFLCGTSGLLVLACVEVDRDGLYAETLPAEDRVSEAGSAGAGGRQPLPSTAGTAGSSANQPNTSPDASATSAGGSASDAGGLDAGNALFESPDADSEGQPAADAGIFDAAPNTTPLCSGQVVAGLCVYLAAAGASCNQACAGRGGFDARLTSVVGSTVQGGSLEACQQMLDALMPGLPAASSGTRDDEFGLGCHLFGSNSDGWWLEAPDFAPTDSVSEAQIVCACAR